MFKKLLIYFGVAVFSLFSFLFLEHNVSDVQAQGICSLPNAALYINKLGKVYGTRATIHHVNLNLNTADINAFVYHRVAVTINLVGGGSPFYFLEFGWDKSNEYGTIAYGVRQGPNDPLPAQLAFRNTPFSLTKHSYAVRYRPNQLRWEFEFDGSFLYGVSASLVGFNVADQSFAGSEACFGVEEIDCVYFQNVEWRKLQNTGQYIWQLWGPPIMLYRLPAVAYPYTVVGTSNAYDFFTTDNNTPVCNLPLP